MPPPHATKGFKRPPSTQTVERRWTSLGMPTPASTWRPSRRGRRAGQRRRALPRSWPT